MPGGGVSRFRARGGAWVAGQFLVGGAAALAAVAGPGRSRGRGVRRVGGLVLVAAGVGLVEWSRRALGPAFTPMPAPRPGAALSASGPYRYVRHPMYAGVILAAAGGCVAGSPCAVPPAAGLAALLHGKAAWEERRLAVSVPGYAAYRSRVRAPLVPGVPGGAA